MASDNIGEVKLKLTLDTAEFDKSQKKVESSVKSTYSVMNQVMGDLTARAIASATTEVKKLAREVVEVGASFDAAMSKVSAVSGATGSDLESLRTKAREMGRVTVFSATESAEAFNYMAMAGWGTQEMLDGIEGVMNLAAASGTDLATTSDIVTDALTAMGYSAKDAGKFADVMAAASANANTNVNMMGESFKYAASVAGSLGYNIEDTSMALGLMANSGIKAEQAGTSLRSILSRMAAPTKEVQEAMDVLGVSLVDDSGNMRSLNDVMVDLRKGFSKLSATQKAEAAESIAGKNAMTGLLAIVNASESDYQKLTKAINTSTGAAEKMAKTMNNNVSGKMKILKSQLQDIYLTLWEKLSPAISKALEKVQSALQKIDWNKVASSIEAALAVLMDGVSWIIDHSDIVIGAVQAFVLALGTKKVIDFGSSVADVASKIGTFGGKILDSSKNLLASSPMLATVKDHLSGISAGLSSMGSSVLAVAGPLAGLIGAVTAVGAAMVGITNAMKDAELGMDNTVGAHARMEKALAESRVSLKSSQREWEELGKKRDAAVNEGLKEIDYYKRLADELDLMVDKNGRVKSGYEDRAKFITTTLSKALGIEIEYTEGIVQGYDGIRDSITKTIEAKKAELLLTSQEEVYNTAIKKRMELSRQMAQLADEIRIAGEQGRTRDRLKIEDHLAELRGQYEQYAISIGQYENNMALYTQGKYDEMSQTIFEYTGKYKTAEEAVKGILLDEVVDTTAQLGAMKKAYEVTGLEIFNQQKETAQASLDAKKDEVEKYFGTTEEYLLKVLQAWDNNLDLQLSEITGRNVQFVDAGKGLVNMLVDGVVAKEGLSKESMAKLVDATINEVDVRQQNALKAGTNLINGVTEGLRDGTAQQKALNAVNDFGNGVIRTIENTWDENSPSKVGQQDGAYLIYGIRNGISDGGAQGSVFAAVGSFANRVVSQFKAAFDIHSPSRLMRDMVGKNIAAGIGVGFEDEMDNVEKDMRTEVRNLADDIYAAVPTFDYSVASMANTIIDTPDVNQALISDGNYTEHKQPLVVNLVLDGKQIQQVILQDIRRSI